MCALAAWAAYSLDSTVLYGMVALSLISFLGSVSVTRFRVPDTAIDPDDPRSRPR
ncbi:Putative cation antiporter subunit [Mycobacteroides abscessus]|nr:Putative cation antiporter subunit [Mycobacteroides abscessus]CPZ83792.1 Putative cation antiporter subunit [Mycobacteroides abscessus]